MTTRIEQARQETQKALDKALSYSYDLQKPTQIEFYAAHLDYLACLAKGQTAIAPKADKENWDQIRVVLDARQ